MFSPVSIPPNPTGILPCIQASTTAHLSHLSIHSSLLPPCILSVCLIRTSHGVVTIAPGPHEPVAFPRRQRGRRRLLRGELRRRQHGAGGAEGRLRRAPRQVRGRRRVRIRVCPEWPLVTAGAAARGPREHAARSSKARPPELEEEGWHGELSLKKRACPSPSS